MSKLRFLTSGESHGPALVAILEGMLAGLPLNKKDIQLELEKRRSGAGRGGRGQIEKDKVKILSGVRFGKTLGSPIALMVENQDFENWKQEMDIESPKSRRKSKKIHTPRPGHADFAGSLKYGFNDVRNVLERASARETLMRVAIGAICKKLLSEFSIKIASHTIQIGQIKLIRQIRNFKEISEVYQKNPEIRCVDKDISKQMKQAIKKAQKNKDTLGGVIEVIAHNVPPGLGSYVHYDRRLDGKLAEILMSIPSVKAVEIGEGITNTSCFGSQVHDEIYYRPLGPTLKVKGEFFRRTNRAGGIEGGVSNGEDIICRVYHKPLSSLKNPLRTVNLKTKKAAKAHLERSDICAVPRAGVISEAAVAFVICNFILEKFGGDALKKTKENYLNYLSDLRNL